MEKVIVLVGHFMLKVPSVWKGCCILLHNSQDGRPPPAYFLPSHFLKMKVFKKMKTLFFSRKHSFPSSSYFLILPTSKFFLFFAKKQLKRKDIFKKIILFDTHSTANLPPLAILKKMKFFQKRMFSIQKNPNFERIWEFLNSVALYGKFEWMIFFPYYKHGRKTMIQIRIPILTNWHANKSF